MGSRSLACAVAATMMVAPAIARADDDDDEPMIVVEPSVPDATPAPPPTVAAPVERPAPKRYVDVSYGSQTLLLDGVAVAMFVPGVAAKIDPLPGLGILTYWLGPSIVHLTHGNVGKGFADLGIRTIAPFLFAVPGLMVAAAATSGENRATKEDALDVGGFTGMALGCAFAMAVDAFLLAKERVPAERAYLRDDAKLRLTPKGAAGRF